MNESYENCLLENWTEQMQHQVDVYKEPFLDERTLNLIKITCETFKQDLQVFFMTVEMVEHYVYLKELKREEIDDPFLTIGVSIFITSKFFGGGSDLKIPFIEKLLYRLTGRKYNCKTIMTLESEMLKVFEYKLPIITILDDLETFFEKIMREYRLKAILKPLCLEILVLLYCKRKKWFPELKKFYSDELKTFQYLICSKLYLPAGILISAFKITNYQFIIDLNGMLQDLKTFTKIHPDHIHALSAIILDAMKQ